MARTSSRATVRETSAPSWWPVRSGGKSPTRPCPASCPASPVDSLAGRNGCDRRSSRSVSRSRDGPAPEYRTPSSQRNTLLRLITSLPHPPTAMPRVIGADEYAQRKGRIYATLLVDVETRRPVDLPDREADTLAGLAVRTTRDRDYLPGPGLSSTPRAPPAAPLKPSRSPTEGTSGKPRRSRRGMRLPAPRLPPART